MRKWLLLILSAALFASPSPVGAQSGIILDTVNVQLWSEYDQPSMLVLYDLVVAPTTQLPAQITLRFPKDGNLIAVAYNSVTGLLNAEFDAPIVQGDWQAITLKITSPVAYHVEYYQPLGRDGSQRQFTYRWPGDYAVQNFNLSLQLPADSKNLNTTPVLTNTVTDSSFLTSSSSISGLKAGQTYQLQIEYERASETISKPSDQQVQPSAPIDENTPGRVTLNNLPWILGGVGLVFIVIALIYYWRSSQQQSGKPRRRHRRAADEESDQQVYCHECGTRARPGDHFCRTCGSRLRVE